MDIVGGEENRIDHAHQFGGGPADPANPDLFSNGVAFSSGSPLSALRIRPVEHALVTHVDRQPLPVLFDDASHQGLTSLGGRLEVDHFPLVLRTVGAGDGQEVDGLQQRGLTLGIAAKKHGHAYREVQFHLHQIAEISQAEA